MHGNVSLRPMTAGDLEFSRRVYASTRWDVQGLPWTPEQKDAFLSMQFRAQHTYYHDQFPAADYLIVERDGQAIGRLFVDRRTDTIHILDIALLPETRGTGLGTHLLQQLLAEASESGRNVSLFVERENCARNLYQRLSFEPAGEEGIYTLMRWKCPQSAAK